MRGRPVLGTLAALCVLGAAACTSAPPATERVATRTPAPSTSAPAWPSSPWPAGPWPEPPDRPVPADVARRLDAEVHRWVDDGFLPGVTVAVVGPAGVWTGAAGEDGAGAALNADSATAIGSITKTLTAAEVLLLAEQGRLGLDDAVADHVGRSRLVDGATVRQLLSHRSGLTDPDDEAFEPVFADPDRSMGPDLFLRGSTRAEAPGREFLYANVNYALLGELVEEVTGRPFEDAVERDLLSPLGLPRLVVQSGGPVAPPRAAPGPATELSDLEPSAYLPIRSLATLAGAAGGAAGDAESVARWGHALYGGRVLSAASLTTMLDTEDDGYGLGLMDFSRLELGTSTLAAVGHLGEISGYCSALAVFPSAQLAVVVLTPSGIDALPFVRWVVNAGGLTPGST